VIIEISIYLFISGLLFGSGPCIATCGPILISYIAGTNKHFLKALGVYALFSLARITVYLLLAIVIFFFGKFSLERLLGDYFKLVVIIGGGFVVLVGLLTALGRRHEIKPFNFLYKNIVEQDKKSIVLLGIIMGILPCAPLLAILSYIGLVSKGWVISLVYALSFGLGTILSPLIILAGLSGLLPGFFVNKRARYSRIFSLICGLIIVVLGIQLISRAL